MVAIFKPLVHLPTVLQFPNDYRTPSSTSTEPQKRTLPPIEPVYRKKAMSVLKKALKKGKVSDNGSSSASANKKHSKQQRNEAKTEAKEKKEQQKNLRRNRS